MPTEVSPVFLWSVREGGDEYKRNICFVQCFGHKIGTSENKKPRKLCLRGFFVENIGVEPMTSCMPCKRSSQLS